ncbi:MAG TPA: type II secretion system F family protein [Candidatus Brocadiia bacterium]|nr:type II secretion system F family protein [Candidatus Brocadiia bacterium]
MNPTLILEILTCSAAFACAAIVSGLGVQMFRYARRSYEERYLADAERSLDAIYISLPPQHVVYLSGVCFLCAALVFLSFFGNALVSMIFAIPALAIPRLVLWWMKRNRDRKFDRQLVDGLLSLANSLKAGLSLQQAIGVLATEMPDPMRQEMRITSQEMQVGVPMEEALDHLLKRMPGQDLDLVVTSILIARDVGGNLADIFDNIAYMVRERHRIEGKVRALSSQGKLQGIVICCIPPILGVALNVISPNYIRPLYATPAGWMICGLVALMIVLGMWTIYRIVNIEV